MACPHRAVLIVTTTVDGTSTSIARDRKTLNCSLPPLHDGPHHDSEFNESWVDTGSDVTHILRHDEDTPA
ncbi:MAG TPA: hypothetical protein VN764_13160 [Polyangiaceae bacterium]|nr:hypothetical protein [Polyangiaceae bacterium]